MFKIFRYFLINEMNIRINRLNIYRSTHTPIQNCTLSGSQSGMGESREILIKKNKHQVM